jgi:hypothetical protein
MQTFCMIIEMRTYKIKPGMRAEFLKVFESKARPEHEKIGMKILGTVSLCRRRQHIFLDARFSRSEEPRTDEGSIL